MPTTRSQGKREEDERPSIPYRVFEQPPASPSQATSMRAQPEPPSTSAAPRTTAATHVAAESRQSRPQSIRSIRTTASASARIRQAELAAEEKMAALRRKELEIEMALVKKRLECNIADIQEDTERDSECQEETADIECDNRVQQWIRQSDASRIRGENEAHAPDRQQLSQEENDCARETETYQPPTRHRSPSPVANYRSRTRSPDCRRRYRSPSPRERDRRPYGPHAHSPPPTNTKSKDRGIERLAEALENMARTPRPVPRQAPELPLFSGAPGEWLPFKAAVRDSTVLYNYSPMENLARLRNCLRGEARETVAALLYTSTSPAPVMKTLEQCYGRPEVIIDKTLEDIKRLPRPGSSASELNTFAVKLQNVVCVLTNLDEVGYLHNPMLTREVLEKLSPHLRSRWCDYAEDHKDRSVPSIVTLSDFIMREADRALRHNYSSAATKDTAPRREANQRAPLRTEKRTRNAAVFTVTEQTQPVKKRRCSCCQGEHELEKCRKFSAMDMSRKWEFLKEQRLCFKCLRGGHRRPQCRGRPCGIDGCKTGHHAMLHETREPKQHPEVNAEASTEGEETVTAATASTTGRQRVMLKICPVRVKGPTGLEINTYALLDEGSTVTLLDSELADMIEAKGPTRPLRINGVNASQSETNSRDVEICIQGRGGDSNHRIRARTVKNLTLGKQTVLSDRLKYSHLRDISVPDLQETDVRPRLLIGADNWHLIVTRELRVGRKNEPVASLTELGWVIHGTAPRAIIKSDNETVLHIATPEYRPCGCDDVLEALVRENFTIDSLKVAPVTCMTKDEQKAHDKFNATVRRLNGRMEVGLPWREDNPTLPESYDAALKRLRTIEKKMDISDAFKREYTAQIANLLDKGYAEKVDGTETHSPVAWYLPHFAVRNLNKPGKIRLVFDAAAKSRGLSLNDKLLDGPDLLRSLPGILFRFRERKVAVTADIREMFLQVKIRKEDQPAQMFLWRGDNRSEPPQQFKMTSMIFGARSSPFLAHSVRNRNAEDHAETHPRALYAITKSHYMDDLVDSYEDEDEAISTIKEVSEVHSRAGFTLASWNTNNERVLEHTPHELRAKGYKELGCVNEESEKTLGLLWISKTDELCFNTSLNRVPGAVKELSRSPTKREALSAVMSIYDPLGLISYYTITAKIILQNVWRTRIQWEDDLPEAETDEFRKWIQGTEHINQLRIPRLYDKTGGASIRNVELHTFCDASEAAFAAASYWRIEHHDGSITVSLAAAKAKVAPLRSLSIPRLELQAALIGVRVANLVTTEHRLKPSRVIFWSDSRTTLQWIRNENARYTPFVAHRLGEISESTRPKQWRWVPGPLNVADDATRLRHEAKTENDRWFIGPAFLYDSEERWPTEQTQLEQEEIQEQVYVVDSDLEGSDALPDVTRFSSYERLVRSAARVLAFVDMMKHRASKMELRHVEAAELLLIRRAQRESFPEDAKALNAKKSISKGSRLSKLDPELVEGVLRLKSRTSVNPIILDGKHPLTKLLVLHYHRRALHANNETVVNNLRQQYWILKLRPTVKTVATSCQLCRLRKCVPNKEAWGNLPPARLDAYARPFSNCGIDYFGPMSVVIGRRREKRWGALFTCLVTRAVHVELVPSLSTDSAIMALRRMAARRGWPKIIYSDNATNFRGADVELRAAVNEWQKELEEVALSKRAEWRFIAPGAPNQGGAWERLVRSVKVALAATLHSQAPKEEVLATLLTEAEHTINSRPLTHVSVSADDEEALTPNHFLLGSSTGLPTTGTCELADRRTWRAAMALADAFWRRWIREYLPTLAPRGGISQDGASIKEGDLVVVVDSNLPRNTWPRGRVQRLYEGPDGRTRNVEVKTRGGVFKRPTCKLAVLKLEEAA